MRRVCKKQPSAIGHKHTRFRTCCLRYHHGLSCHAAIRGISHCWKMDLRGSPLPHPRVSCAFLAFLSLQIMALTAINRYFRVIKPRFYRKVFTPFHTTLMIAVTSVLCFVALASVTFGQHNSFVFHPGKVICVTLHENIFSSQVFTTFSSVAFVFLPACVVIWCYTKVFRAIRRHFRQLASRRVSTVSLNNLTPAEIVVTRTVFAIVLAFFICWIPCIVIDIVDVMRDEWFDRQVYLAYTYFAYTSSAINPFIYGVLNRSFRVEYLKLLRCR